MYSIIFALYFSIFVSIKLSKALTITSNSSSTAVDGHHIAEVPTLDCYHQDPDPGLGFLSAFCVCDETVSLPEVTPTPDFGDRTE